MDASTTQEQKHHVFVKDSAAGEALSSQEDAGWWSRGALGKPGWDASCSLLLL